MGKNVKAIKQLTNGITNQMKTDEAVLSTLNSGFDRSKAMVQRTLSKMDGFIGHASTSMTTYIVLFVIMMMALLYKLVL